jgi:hypothetical protein
MDGLVSPDDGEDGTVDGEDGTVDVVGFCTRGLLAELPFTVVGELGPQMICRHH